MPDYTEQVIWMPTLSDGHGRFSRCFNGNCKAMFGYELTNAVPEPPRGWKSYFNESGLRFACPIHAKELFDVAIAG